jgi:aldose 1-epimerase
VDYKAICLKNDVLEIEVSELGGCISRLNYRMDSEWVPLMRKSAALATFADSACWPMAPYCGRVCTPAGKPGVLSFGGVDYPLGDEDYQRDYAIHGPACRLIWKIQQSGSNAIIEVSDHLHPQALAALYPFKFSLSSKYRLKGASVLCETKLTNTGGSDMPAGFGYHPFWVREPAGVSEIPLLKFSAEGVYPKKNDILLPMGEPEPLPEELNFSEWRGVPFELDHGFTAIGDCLSILWPESGIQADISLESPFRHAVVYSPERGRFAGHFALEWQTCASNAGALEAMGVKGAGLCVLSPGESLMAEWRLDVRRT